MPKVRMRDTTSLGSGPLLAGEVYDLSDEDAAHLKSVGLAGAAQSDTETYAEKQARLSDQVATADENGPPMNPDIARQVREAGSKEGDQSTGGTGTREPLNAPPTAALGRAETQRATGATEERRSR